MRRDVLKREVFIWSRWQGGSHGEGFKRGGAWDNHRSISAFTKERGARKSDETGSFCVLCIDAGQTKTLVVMQQVYINNIEKGVNFIVFTTP